MSDFTTQLRFICESYAGRTEEGSEAHDVDSIIALARPQLFNFDYPIFDEAYKPELETKIINHFYTQEIGQETVGLFKQRLKTKMREIMPYYNQLYMSERLKFDPFKNADYVDLHNASEEGSRRGTNDNSSSFQNSTVNDVDNTHNDTTNTTDSSSGLTHEEGNGSDTKTGSGTSNTTTSNTENFEESGSTTVNNTLTMSGKETTTNKLTSPQDVIYKEADTPLGSVGSSSGGEGPSGINSGYLSKLTETRTNGGNTESEKSFTGRKDATDGKTTSSSKSTKTGSGTSNTTTSNTENGTNEFAKDGTHSDSSQGSVVNNGGYHIDNDTISNGASTSNTVDTANTKNKQDYFGKVFGKVGSETYSEMLNKFRATFLNIDMDVIHELEPLFMLVW